MIPDAGWNTELQEEILLPPRDIQRTPYIGYSSNFAATGIWTLTYDVTTNTITVIDDIGVVQYTRSAVVDVVRVDLALDSNDSPVVCWETLDKHGGDNFIWVNYYNYDTSLLTLLTFTGYAVCCCLDNIRTNPSEDSDVVIFYKHVDTSIRYLLQRDNFSVDNFLNPAIDTANMTLITCGMNENDTLSLKVQMNSGIFIAVNDKIVGVGTDYVGYPWGIIP